MLDPQLIALITGLFTALMALAKWSVGQWAQVRREGFAQNERMITAVVEQASSNATLTGRIDTLGVQLAQLSDRLDDGFESISKVTTVPPGIRKETRETYPPPSRIPRERAPTPPVGHHIREPRRGTHHDPDD